MKTKDIKKGISLIVLIITIIVVMILAAVVILTLSKNNPIESAKEARFKEDVRTFQDELSLYISKQYANAGGHWDGSISAKKYDEIVKYIPSFTKKYEGKFIINNNNLEYTDKLDEKEKEYSQNLNVKENVLKLLPDEYQQVEYIESTGTQYIDTRFSPNNESGLILRLNYTQVPTSPNKPFGVYYNNNAIRWYGLNPSDRGNKWSYGWNDWHELDINFSIGFHEIKININNDRKAILDNRPVYSLPNCTFGTGKTAYIFALNANQVMHFSKVQLYSCELYDNNEEVRNFIPCFSKTTVTNIDGVQVPANTKGLYDTVEGKFYTNKGTGEFIAGPDVD